MSEQPTITKIEKQAQSHIKDANASLGVANNAISEGYRFIDSIIYREGLTVERFESYKSLAVESLERFIRFANAAIVQAEAAKKVLS